MGLEALTSYKYIILWKRQGTSIKEEQENKRIMRDLEINGLTGEEETRRQYEYIEKARQ